jgi:hypothetical protein
MIYLFFSHFIDGLHRPHYLLLSHRFTELEFTCWGISFFDFLIRDLYIRDYGAAPDVEVLGLSPSYQMTKIKHFSVLLQPSFRCQC